MQWTARIGGPEAGAGAVQGDGQQTPPSALAELGRLSRNQVRYYMLRIEENVSGTIQQLGIAGRETFWQQAPAIASVQSDAWCCVILVDTEYQRLEHNNRYSIHSASAISALAPY